MYGESLYELSVLHKLGYIANYLFLGCVRLTLSSVNKDLGEKWGKKQSPVYIYA